MKKAKLQAAAVSSQGDNSAIDVSTGNTDVPKEEPTCSKKIPDSKKDAPETNETTKDAIRTNSKPSKPDHRNKKRSHRRHGSPSRGRGRGDEAGTRDNVDSGHGRRKQASPNPYSARAGRRNPSISGDASSSSSSRCSSRSRYLGNMHVPRLRRPSGEFDGDDTVWKERDEDSWNGDDWRDDDELADSLQGEEFGRMADAFVDTRFIDGEDDNVCIRIPLYMYSC